MEWIVVSGQQIRGKVIGSSLGSVTYVSFSPDDSQVAACVDRTVYILNALVRFLFFLHGIFSEIIIFISIQYVFVY